MTRVDCKTCNHFRTAPYEALKTGCWHPDNMSVTQKDAYLQQQEAPGNHERINLRGDCAQHEPRPKKLSLWDRFLGKGA